VVVVPVGRLINVVGQDQRSVGTFFGTFRLDDQRLFEAEIISPFIVELAEQAAEIGDDVEYLEPVDIALLAQSLDVSGKESGRVAGDRREAPQALLQVGGRCAVARRRNIQPLDRQRRIALLAPVRCDLSDQ
jgi:hypothetical protein